MALVPFLDEQRLKLLEEKLKKLFSMVKSKRIVDIENCPFQLDNGCQTKCDEKILSNSRRIMFAIDRDVERISQRTTFSSSSRSSSSNINQIAISFERSSFSSSSVRFDGEIFFV